MKARIICIDTVAKTVTWRWKHRGCVHVAVTRGFEVPETLWKQASRRAMSKLVFDAVVNFGGILWPREAAPKPNAALELLRGVEAIVLQLNRAQLALEDAER